jgi:tubulin monoglycylase TTLL3/8
MLDENGTPWLIEVNSSPAMDYSTPVTTELVKEVLNDTVKVVVDYHYASNKRKPKVDTGNWSLIYKAKRAVERPQHSFGLNLLCEGKAIKKR